MLSGDYVGHDDTVVSAKPLHGLGAFVMLEEKGSSRLTIIGETAAFFENIARAASEAAALVNQSTDSAVVDPSGFR